MALAGLGLIAALAAAYFLWPRGREMPAGPTSIRPLTSMAGIEGDPSWSPDGTFLAFDHFPGPASLFVVPTAGGDPVLALIDPALRHLPGTARRIDAAGDKHQSVDVDQHDAG